MYRAIRRGLYIMNAMRDPKQNYAAAVLLGAVGGGILVALASRAVPKMMEKMMAGIMQNMFSQMSESGCDPSEM